MSSAAITETPAHLRPRQYYGGFGRWSDVVVDFRAVDAGLEPDCVYAAYADRGAGSGEAFVVFKRGDQWFYNIGSHCSCRGLEGQWEPCGFSPIQYFFGIRMKKRIFMFIRDDGVLPEVDEDKFHDWLVKYGE